jgi:hypothetical protein
LTHRVLAGLFRSAEQGNAIIKLWNLINITKK